VKCRSQSSEQSLLSPVRVGITHELGTKAVSWTRRRKYLKTCTVQETKRLLQEPGVLLDPRGVALLEPTKRLDREVTTCL
jgi:hypothetical protein